jgi:hypothetical protein
MSIRIEIVINDDCPYEDVATAFETQMKAIGFVRDVPKAQDQPMPLNTAIALAKEALDLNKMSDDNAAANTKIEEDFRRDDAAKSCTAPTRIIIGESADAGAAAIVKPTAMDGDRERGKAGPGHRRRTNAQIEADDAYFAAHPPAAPLAPGSTEPLPPGVDDAAGFYERQREAANGRSLISTGEERINPEDAADEAAETAARVGDKPTIEDLRAAVGRYTEKFGAKASIENIRTILGKPIIEVPEEEIGAAIARVEAATAGHVAPEQTKPADLPTEPVHATKVDVIEALTAYGKKYDGSADPSQMPITKEDGVKILTAAFGAGVVSVSKIPQTPEGFGKALSAINAAVRDNPFKRAVRS